MKYDAVGNAKMLYRALQYLRKEKKDHIQTKKIEVLTKKNEITKIGRQNFNDLLESREDGIKQLEMKY